MAEALNWQFTSSYTTLPEAMYRMVSPVPVANPKLVIFNGALAESLGLNASAVPPEVLAAQLSGNVLADGSTPLALAYAGHQFGHFTLLGDGRAHLLGEHRLRDGSLVDIQLKGSGATPFARRGDGRAALAPMLREYLISEAMHALRIPTTRSLAVVTTGEPVMRDTLLTGAILTRVAASHLRIGSFELLAAQKDAAALQQLADFAIARHDPALVEAEHPYRAWLKAVMQRQIALVCDWLRVGFIHGVMNTDNMTISGETIDYGPCAFMDHYDPQTVFSSIDRHGRYAYANQAGIAQWNLARLAEAILPLLHEDVEQAIDIGEEIIGSFGARFQSHWLGMMRRKLGITEASDEADTLVGDLLQWMQRQQMDYTQCFVDLMQPQLPDSAPYQQAEFQAWHTRWLTLQSADSSAIMQQENPLVIPRNHQVEAALEAAEAGDLAAFEALLAALKHPYADDPASRPYRAAPAPSQRVYQTFCGT